MRRALLAMLAAVAAVAAVPAPAGASSYVIARDAKRPALKVDRYGRALVTYTQAGTLHRVLLWGAVNANPDPAGADSPQQSFRKDYSGGWKTFGRRYWATMRDVCRPYDGPRLAWVVAACKAPDGSYWALQSWRRMLPNVRPPWTTMQRASELHLGHWKGPLPDFWFRMDWFYTGQNVPGGSHQHLYGELTWRGRGLYGFGTTTWGNPTDPFGVLVYLDVRNPGSRRGWHRYNSWVTHNPRGARRDDGTPYAGGGFCAGIYRTIFGRTGPWWGDRYRATVSSPGVFPLLYHESASRGWLDPVADLVANAEQRDMFPDADGCSDTLDNTLANGRQG